MQEGKVEQGAGLGRIQGDRQDQKSDFVNSEWARLAGVQKVPPDRCK